MSRNDKLLYYVFLSIAILLLGSTIYYKRVIAIGESMDPTIGQYSIAFVQNYPDLDQDLTGKIVAYDKVNYNVIHRVIEDNNDYLVTRGDNCDKNDAIVMRSQLTGIMDFSLPYFFWIIEYLLITVCYLTVFFKFMDGKKLLGKLIFVGEKPC